MNSDASSLPRRSLVARYGTAVAAPVIAAAVRVALLPWSGQALGVGDFIWLLLFIAIGIVISLLTESLHRGRERERVAREQAERAEFEARVAEQRVSSLIESVPGVVWEASGHPDAATQRIDFVSGYVHTMLGYSVQEWLQTPNFWLTLAKAGANLEKPLQEKK